MLKYFLWGFVGVGVFSLAFQYKSNEFSVSGFINLYVGVFKNIFSFSDLSSFMLIAFFGPLIFHLTRPLTWRKPGISWWEEFFDLKEEYQEYKKKELKEKFNDILSKLPKTERKQFIQTVKHDWKSMNQNERNNYKNKICHLFNKTID